LVEIILLPRFILNISVETMLEQRYNFVGTIGELVKTVALIGGLHGSFKERLEIIQSMHC
jgi:hypothetical protein